MRPFGKTARIARRGSGTDLYHPPNSALAVALSIIFCHHFSTVKSRGRYEQLVVSREREAQVIRLCWVSITSCREGC